MLRFIRYFLGRKQTPGASPPPPPPLTMMLTNSGPVSNDTDISTAATATQPTLNAITTTCSDPKNSSTKRPIDDIPIGRNVSMKMMSTTDNDDGNGCSSVVESSPRCIESSDLVLSNESNTNVNVPPVPLPPPPYHCRNDNSPTDDMLLLWNFVGKQIDADDSVDWGCAVKSLEHAHHYLELNAACRSFVERNAGRIVNILSSQFRNKIGIKEQVDVQNTLHFAILIVVKDLNIQLHRGDVLSTTTNNTFKKTTVDGTTAAISKVPVICGECILIDTVLSHMFNRNKQFFKGYKDDSQSHSLHHINQIPLSDNTSSNNSNSSNSKEMGCPEVRIRNIGKFREENGFILLHAYLLARLPYCAISITSSASTNDVMMSITTGAGSTYGSDTNPNAVVSSGARCTTQSYCFPTIETLYHVLTALFDTLPIHPVSINDLPMEQSQSMLPLEQQQQMDAINISKAIMTYLRQLATDDIQKLTMKYVNRTLRMLRKIFDCLAASHRCECIEFYSFYRSVTLSMISSALLPLKISGWTHVSNLIGACNEHRPPRQYRVSDAGCSFVNGIYDFAGPVIHDGYAKPGTDLVYVRNIPLNAIEGVGKKLTLFRCTMRSQKKWWFISEADNEQPGTDRDVDYYRHKSKNYSRHYPPVSGWETCRSVGIDPPLTLKPIGWAFHNGEEMNVFEHQLVVWVIENNVADIATREACTHSEIARTSCILVEFLSSKFDWKNGTLSVTGASSTYGSDTNSNVFVPTGALCTTPSYRFPSIETLFHILTAVFDTLPIYPVTVNDQHMGRSQQQLQAKKEMDAINISKAIMTYLRQLATDDIQKLTMKYVNRTLMMLRKIFDCLAARYCCEYNDFYSSYRSMTLSMISSTVLPLKLRGWTRVSELIDACHEHRPPPRQYRVSDAGCSFVNGVYDFAGTVTHDGYVEPGTDLLYVRNIPLDAIEGAGKKLTLFRCTMRSQKKWWFISEANNEQPGTDQDIDYYKHKSKTYSRHYPPVSGWETCRSVGIDPPPTLQPIGRVVPDGEEMNLFENQLVLWMLENNVVDLATREALIQNEISIMSSVLMKFLASKVDW